VDVYLTKPVKHSDLLDALATLFGGSVRRDRAETPPQPASSPVKPLRILVAEDHPVNRKLVTTLLTKRGHTVESVDNGRSAVDAVALAGARPFDVVIMDVQMPTMSGLEASVAIREREQTTGEHLPIVALTAHAMQGDRERCLQAGMDSYLSKPIDVDRLIATVEAAGSGQSTQGAAAPSPGAPDAIFDEQAALRHTGGDRKLLRKIVNLFRADAAASLKKIGGALSRRDPEALWTTAHALKGSLATIGAQAARRTTADIERLGRAGSFDDARDLYANLQQQLRTLDRMLLTAGLVGSSRPRPAKKPAKPRSRKHRSRGRS
ncbi:MAG TPA: response regulator, partial [Vicinamibacterales bacterium]